MRPLPVATAAHTTAHHWRPQRPVFISPYARQRTEKRLGDAHNSFVRTQADKSLSLLPRIMTTATTLASTAGFAVLMAWMPLLLEASRDTLPISIIEDATPEAMIDGGTQPLEGLARRKGKCAECGLIESIRETEEDSEAIPFIAAGGPMAENRNRLPARSAGREITVRLQDGSSRVMIDTNPGKLRLGERVKVIDGHAGSGA
jgi:hypothetical protein